MKFTTGKKELYQTSFTVKRVKDIDLHFNYDIEIGKQVAFNKAQNEGVYLYHNVPAKKVKVGENVYTQSGDFLGYRCE